LVATTDHALKSSAMPSAHQVDSSHKSVAAVLAVTKLEGFRKQPLQHVAT